MPMVRVERPPRNEQLANINSLIASTERVVEECLQLSLKNCLENKQTLE